MIKTKIIEQPTHRTINIICPSCNTQLSRQAKIDQWQGKEECGLCHTKFVWEETEDSRVKP